MQKYAKITLLIVVLAILALSVSTSNYTEKSKPQTDGQVFPAIKKEFVEPRLSYKTSLEFKELIRPNFYAVTENGERVEPAGNPEIILEQKGKIKIALKSADGYQYFDLLGLESELIGEHPVHKIYRLQAMGITIPAELLEKISKDSSFPNNLFYEINFEYLPGKETRGVISEIFQDGTFLIIPYQIPEEWRANQAGQSDPTHFHLDSRALSSKTSSLAKEYEKEILQLSFDDQRYPPSALAKKDCKVYEESTSSAEYGQILYAAGFSFLPLRVSPKTNWSLPTIEKAFSAILWEGAGSGSRYFGWDGFWLADRLRDLGLNWLQECDAVFGIAPWSKTNDFHESFYAFLRNSLAQDPKQRYKIISIKGDGSAETIYNSPGVMLMALPYPQLENYWFFSTEGWPDEKQGKAADPRRSSVYVVNTNNQEEYYLLEFPFDKYFSAPKTQNGKLYGSSEILSPSQRFLFVSLYGFIDEGGGLWAVDISAEKFHKDPSAFSRIVPWDHALSIITLDYQDENTPAVISLLLTGKEVADGFSMTANYLRITDNGLDSKIEKQERLLKMVGWNPVPFFIQKTGEHNYRVMVETYFNYESSLLPRAQGVYIVSIDTSK